MTRKRRVFDLDLPQEGPEPAAQTGEAGRSGSGETFPAGKVSPGPGPDHAPDPALDPPPPRRGPMATAIGETTGALQERARIAAEIRAENDALAHDHVRARDLGLIADLVPLDAILAWKLTRDRQTRPEDDAELRDLAASIRDIGLSNPIRLEARDDGRFELVQGSRRLAAYRRLLAETGDTAAWGLIPALVMPQGVTLDMLYRRMVDENLVRRDISFAEMAMLAIAYADDPATPEMSPDRAVAVLYTAAGYQKRSYIRAFIGVMAALDGALRFPAEIPRALGLALAQRLEQEPGMAGVIRAALAPLDNRSVAEELALLRRFAGPGGLAAAARQDDEWAGAGSGSGLAIGAGDGAGAVWDPVPEPAPRSAGVQAGLGAATRTQFRLTRPQGQARCTAMPGRIEIRLDRDFSTIDRARLEAAVQALLDWLD